MPESDISSAPPRLLSLDAWRGFVMLLMMAEIMDLASLAKVQPSAEWARHLAFHTSHVEWIGCSLHDMIQPSFSFLVGASMVFSFARRAQEGPRLMMMLHAVKRGLVLVLLGVFLRSLDYDHTHWTLEDTLTQIGLGYPFLFALGFAGPKVQWSALGVILLGYWAFFALHAVPDNFDYAAVEAGPGTVLKGFAGHWSMGSNAAAAFDVWLFNRPGFLQWPLAFHHNSGGYCTLSFIPTLGTMLMGLLTGRILISPRTHGHKLTWLVIAAAAGIALGLLLDATGVCPLVKRIWTPSWTLFSGGICCCFLAFFYTVADVWGLRRGLFVLKVIGMNSIAAYLMAHLWTSFINEALIRHFGALADSWTSSMEFRRKELRPEYLSAIKGAAILVTEWLILLWLYRRKFFIKV